jgi:hypothetical protein
MAHAFGFPVVPDVKTKTARSVIVAFAGGGITEGTGKSVNLRRVIDGSFGAGMESNEDRFRVKWRLGPLTNSARSGVEIIVCAFDTPRQCCNVSSDLGQYHLVMVWAWNEPRRLMLMSPATALNLESAKIVMNISGEFVVKTATQSPLEIPLDSRNATSR